MKKEISLNYSQLSSGRQEYEYAKWEFLHKHVFNHVDDSCMENNTYHKEYVCDDGAVWYEVCGICYITVPLSGSFKEINVSTCVDVKLFRTEYWSTDNARSKYCYEIY